MKHRILTGILVLTDIAIISLTPFIALLIRFDGAVESRYYQLLHNVLPLVVIISILIYFSLGLYQRLWRYAGMSELLAIVRAVTLGVSISGLYMYFFAPGMPRIVFFLSWVLNIIFVGGSRVFARMLYYWQKKKDSNCSNVLIIGAGDAGVMIAREIKQRYYGRKNLVGFIDDSEYKKNQIIFGVRVFGDNREIKEVATQYGINEIIIAMPSVSSDTVRKIVNECKKTKCEVKIVPGIYDLIDGRVSLQQLRNVDVEDLLCRDAIKLNTDEIAGYLKSKRVLVTGAGGSIGSELCRQIAKMSPQSITLLGKGENSIYEIDREIRLRYPDINVSPVIADIRDRDRINNVFSAYRPHVIFHAAAHKHVPLMESQPEEAIRNNIFGTKIVAEAADRFNAETFVMISTDKAVNPTSVMGATKRVAELVIENMNSVSNTRFVAVRFGNVLGSRGSVIPLFKKQIAAGGPVTVTHPDMRRYFMTIPEASQLVLQAGALAKGGEVFVLDMGQPIKILDMACELIELSGFTPNKDIKIEFTGLRPGEKLFEELLTAEEGTSTTKHEKIFVANLKAVDERKLQKCLVKLKSESNSKRIQETLAQLVPTYVQSMDGSSVANLADRYSEQTHICESVTN